MSWYKYGLICILRNVSHSRISEIMHEQFFERTLFLYFSWTGIAFVLWEGIFISIDDINGLKRSKRFLRVSPMQKDFANWIGSVSGSFTSKHIFLDGKIWTLVGYNLTLLRADVLNRNTRVRCRPSQFLIFFPSLTVASDTDASYCMVSNTVFGPFCGLKLTQRKKNLFWKTLWEVHYSVRP